MKRFLVAASLVLCALAPSAGRTEPVKQEAEFAPRKAYRECLNRSFAFLLIRGRGGRSPDTIAESVGLPHGGKSTGGLLARTDADS
jgi:hypothetical protein